MNSDVSIIVPLYNATTYLDNLISTVKSQTKMDWELILVDDGSIDGTLELCKKYEREDERIHVLHINNSGPDIARLEGVRYSKRKYIMFLDADDTLSADALYVLYSNILETNADIVISRFDLVWPDGTKKNKYSECLPAKMDKITAIRFLFNQKYYGWELVGKLYRRELFGGGDEREFVYMEDLYRNWYLFNNANLVSVIPNITYHYLQHKKSSTHLSFNKQMLSVLDILQIINTDDRIHAYQSEFDELFFRKYLNVLCAWIFSEVEIGNIHGYIDFLKKKVDSSYVDLSVQNKAAVEFLLNYNKDSINVAQSQLINEIKKYESGHSYIYIYGAGRYAVSLGKMLNESNVKFEGFIVSDGEYLPESPDGLHSVKFVHEYTKKKKCGILIAITEKNYPQVLRVLGKMGVDDFLDLRPYNYLLNR